MVVVGDATARNSYITYLSGKLPNVSPSPYITQIMVGGRKPERGREESASSSPSQSGVSPI